MQTGIVTEHRDTPYGRMRSRSVGRPRPGTAEVVLVQGIGVAEYLLPGLGALGTWTRAHLLELPGYSGSGEPPHEMSVEEFGSAVGTWLATAGPEQVVLAGHSGGTQVAARAAAHRPASVRAVVLASPSIDPRFRSLGGVLRAWHRDNSREPPDLADVHRPERRRAGMRRVVHAVRAHLADHLEDVVPHLQVPVLVLFGRHDLLCTEEWARQLCTLARDGRFAEMPGAHSFPFTHPAAWNDPIRALAEERGRPGARNVATGSPTAGRSSLWSGPGSTGGDSPTTVTGRGQEMHGRPSEEGDAGGARGADPAGGARARPPG